jgi:hypothetical protein
MIPLDSILAKLRGKGEIRGVRAEGMRSWGLEASVVVTVDLQS